MNDKTYVLSDILDMFSLPVEITYRMFIDGSDVFSGMALYEDGTLYSLDGDEYYLDDEFIMFHYNIADEVNRVILTVWSQFEGDTYD